MTNKEKYKQTFDTLSASVNFSLEVDKMSILNRKHKLKTIAAAVAACLIVTAGTGTALHLTRMAPNAALHKKKLWKN